ncbi:hypothetical protein Q2T42_19290 [Leptolyngbya boryana CZ1]|uniref:DUF1574 domain-containing protein n=1 Tax=Leptolyngbya boryana CZ1 TaxID=3060204 RepID=A0AA96WQA2_LEPBY|nr:hypothetical protein [Leptolyngbya boryana]WNZ43980.1 hypothetical protein Q2T42_19290 [Leptolyngbya boryana CZ1]
MKSFTYRLLGFVSMQILVSLVFVIPYLQKYDNAVSQGFMASSIEKHHRLETVSSPRLILVGGSSVAFGINSPDLQARLPYQVINMGIHAGLGAEFMLNEVKSSVKSGDVIVISLEYETFDKFPPDPKQVIDSIEARKENIAFLPLSYVPTLLDEGLLQLGSFLRRSGALIQSGSLERLPYYTRAGFNQYGDTVAHYPLPDDTNKLAGEGRYYRFESERIQRTIRAMNQFYEFCRSQGAQVFFVYPPLMPRVLNMNQAEIAKIETELTHSLRFPILGKPEEFAYSDTDYFDTRYHLNQRGVQQRTEDLVRYLSPYLSTRK